MSHACVGDDCNRLVGCVNMGWVCATCKVVLYKTHLTS